MVLKGILTFEFRFLFGVGLLLDCLVHTGIQRGVGLAWILLCSLCSLKKWVKWVIRPHYISRVTSYKIVTHQSRRLLQPTLLFQIIPKQEWSERKCDVPQTKKWSGPGSSMMISYGSYTGEFLFFITHIFLVVWKIVFFAAVLVVESFVHGWGFHDHVFGNHCQMIRCILNALLVGQGCWILVSSSWLRSLTHLF